MEAATSPDLAKTFAELQQVVADLQARGRKSLVQGVKPQLQRKIVGFDETALGFDTFGAFIRAAEQAGYVTTRRVDRQIEVDLPPGVEPVAQPTVGPRVPRVRKALWDAFTDWSGEHPRYLDTESGGIVELEPGTGDRDDAMEQLVRQNPERFIEVSVASRDAHLAWAREFLALRDRHRLVPFLRIALDNEDESIESFSRLIRYDPELSAEWRVARRRHMADHIQDWAREHGIDVDLEGQDRSPKPAPSDSHVHSEADRGVDEATLRALAHRAIDRMSLGELHDLPIRLGYVRDIR